MKTKNTSLKKNNRNKRKGFTLIEVMVVLFILMVLASMTTLAVRSYLERAKKGEAEFFVKSMETHLEAFHMDHNQYPSDLQDLVTPPSYVDQAKGNWPYVKGTAARLDPWNHPYQYIVPGSHNTDSYDLWSMGPDGITDTVDDITNWK